MEIKIIEKDIYGVVGKEVETVYSVYGREFKDKAEALKAEAYLLKEMKTKELFDSIKNFEGLHAGEHCYYIETKEQMKVFFKYKEWNGDHWYITTSNKYIERTCSKQVTDHAKLFSITGKTLWSFMTHTSSDFPDQVYFTDVRTQAFFYKEFFKNLKEYGILE